MPYMILGWFAVRQNCLIAAAEVYKLENEDGFLKVAEEILIGF